MASPFSVFRKHQKIMIAVLGVLAMGAFVFLPILSDQLETRGTAENPVLVTTKQYGDLTMNEVRQMIWQRNMVRRLIERIAFEFGRRAEKAMADQATLSADIAKLPDDSPEKEAKQAQATALFQEAMLQQQRAMVTQRLRDGVIGPATSDAVVTTWLQAQRAKELGIVVSDQAVNEFLRDLTGNQITATTLRDIYRSLDGSKFWQSQAELQMFDILRRELMALQVRDMFWRSLSATTPAERWDYYQRLNRKAKIEAVAVPVADYVDPKAEPSENELLALFEQGKNRDPNPASDEPGFHEPHRIVVQYFKADYDSITPESISDEDVQRRVEELFENTTEDTPTEDATTTDDAATPDTPSAENAPTNTQEPPSNNTSAGRTASPFRLASYQEEPSEDAPASSESVAAETPAEQPTSEEPTDSEPVITEPADTEPVATEPVPVESTPDNSTPGDETPVDETASETPSDETPAAVEPDVTPIESASDVTPESPASQESREQTARDQLVRERQQAAVEKVTEAMQQLRDAVKRHQDQVAVSAAGTIPDLDYEALAKQHGMTFVETPLVSNYELLDLDIGAAMVYEDRREVPVVAYLFRDGTYYYMPTEASDREGNRFLFWKSHWKGDTQRDQPARTPKFDDPGTREKVLTAWRMIQARDKAQEAAKQMAKEAATAGQPLKDVFSGKNVIEPAPLSWMTSGAAPTYNSPRPRPQLTRIDGIEWADQDFMRDVFALEAGETGTAMDAPKKNVYVVRVAEYSPADDVLWGLFLNVDTYDRYSAVGDSEMVEAMSAWNDELEASAGLEWVQRLEDVDRPEEEVPAE